MVNRQFGVHYFQIDLNFHLHMYSFGGKLMERFLWNNFSGTNFMEQFLWNIFYGTISLGKTVWKLQMHGRQRGLFWEDKQ